MLRVERLAAARDGKRIKESLERALALDPGMHDAEFGIGMYRYYADIAPAVLRFLRWLLLLPGGDRVDGLRQLERAATRGKLVRGEARYQLHVIYLWYERSGREALEIIRALQARYPQQPAVPADRSGDPRRLLPRSAPPASRRRSSCSRSPRRGAVHRADLAAVVARLNIARQLIALQQPIARRRAARSTDRRRARGAGRRARTRDRVAAHDQVSRTTDPSDNEPTRRR